MVAEVTRLLKKEKLWKIILKHNHSKTCQRLPREKLSQGTVGGTVKVRVPDADCGSCDSKWYTKFVVYM